MARKVFFSFHYADVWRANIVRKSWVFKGNKAAGFYDKAKLEKIKRTDPDKIKKWIDEQLDGTSVTVVLIGSHTLDRKFVKYEIAESVEKGNAIIGVEIGDLKDRNGNKSYSQSPKTKVNGIPFDEICDGFYNYVSDCGADYLGKWVEKAARKKGK